MSKKIRDAGRGNTIEGEYLYNLDHGSTMCAIPEKIYDNAFLLAKGNPIREKQIYYDWLGYLDIMQELTTVYANDLYGSAEKAVPNPLYLEEFSDIEIPQSLEKETILLSGLASQLGRFPIWTCDEVELNKLGIGFNDQDEPRRLNQAEMFHKDFNPTCIDSFFNSSYEDDLGEFLCRQGYEVPGICETEPIDPGDLVCRTPDGEVVDPGTFSGGVTCPLSSGFCLKGPGGIGSHSTLNAVDIKNSNNQLVAPFDGEVVGIIGSHCGNTSYHGGDGIIYEGTIDGQIYRVMLYHLNLVDSDVVVGKQYVTGEPIAPLADDGLGGSGRKTPTFDIPAYRGGANIFTEEGRRPSVSSTLTNSLTCSNPLASNRHVHIEVLNVSNIDIYGFSVALGCNPGTNHTCVSKGTPVGTFPDAQELTCEYEETEDDSIPPGSGPQTGCNEFNCAMGAGWSDNFAGSLECASNTLRNNIVGNGRKQHTLGELLDSYGPYCDTVTAAIGQSGISTMPFLSNFFEQIYDPYAFVKRKDSSGNVCNATIPNTPRLQDVGMNCPILPLRKQGIYEDQWNYYVGPIETCTLTSEEMTWNGGVGGRSAEEVLDYVIDNVSYFGITLDEGEQFGVPEDKVRLVIEIAESKDLNPFLLLGLWATESAFGTYWDADHTCNVY